MRRERRPLKIDITNIINIIKINHNKHKKVKITKNKSNNKMLTSKHLEDKRLIYKSCQLC
jgi:hypothetical protein